MRAKFGRDPTFVSKKAYLKFISRFNQTSHYNIVGRPIVFYYNTYMCSIGVYSYIEARVHIIGYHGRLL